MKNITDRVFLFALLVMIAFPFTRAIVPFIGEVNVKSHIMLFLLAFLTFEWLTQKKGENDLLLKYSVTMFISYFCISVVLGRDLSTVAQQSFEYSPFIIACLIIATGMSIPFERVVRWITFAVALSGVLAAYIYFFNTDLMPIEDVSDDRLEWGRLPWRNAYNLLFGISMVLFAAERFPRKNFLVIAVVIGLIPAALTFSRTFFIVVLLIFAIAVLSGLIRNRIFSQLQFYVPLIIAVFVALVSFDFGNALSNVEYRLIGLLTMSSDLSGGVSDRVVLYSQYHDVLGKYPFFGAGFGIPFATFPKVSFYSDVTLVSFSLPFGILGVVAFVLYVTKLWTMLNAVHGKEYALMKTGLKVVLLLALLVSLNDDVWTHKEFSIVIAIVFSSFLNSYRIKKDGSERAL